ncbi:MAG: LLM class flavin-dependent oxidoreductase [SAR202 cluster bacterium]|nr:LLM class flavin-dependent oxidoreductase [SAR202 cluster bacterium]
MALRISMAAPPQFSIPQIADFIARAEQSGFDGVGIADHLEHGHDAYVTITLALAKTSKITVFPSVTNPVTRHPFHLAGFANSLAELAPGRFRLVIGTGDSAVLHIDRKPASADEFRDAVTKIRRLVRGETVAFGNRKEERILTLAKQPAPVIVTASGPKAIAVAGEVADGAMFLIGIDQRIVAKARTYLDEGAKRAGRSLAGFTVALNTVVSIDDDPVAAREKTRGMLFAWTKQGLYNIAYDAVGVPKPTTLNEPKDISDDVLERMAKACFIAGTRRQVIERFEQLRAEGVDEVYCFSAGGAEGRERMLDTLAKEVVPHIR